MTVIIKNIVREYSMEDELMTTRAAVKKAFLLDNFADFQVKFPFVNLGYVTSYGTDINTALNFQTDTEQVDLIKVLTEDVEASVDEGADALNTLDNYAKITYKDSPAKQRVFGQDKWEKARNDQEKMSTALKVANKFANEDPYKTALIAKGYTQTQIDNLLTIADNIDTKNLLQETAKAGRPVVTDDRIRVHNIVWQRDQDLKIMAEEVYPSDPAKRAIFLLYPSTAGGAETTVTVHLVKALVPQQGLQVELTNTDLVPQTSNAEGNAVFTSVNMPEAVDVLVHLTGGGTATRDNAAVIQGEENLIEMNLP